MKRTPRNNRPILAAACALLLSAAVARAATLQVKGLGWFGSGETSRNLGLLVGAPAKETLDAAAVEDAALILFHQLQADGYLHPQLTAEITTADGRHLAHALDVDLRSPVPRPLRANKIVFRVKRGTRYLIEETAFTGLNVMKPDDARRFFTGDSALIRLPVERLYSPEGAQRSAGNLEEELRLRGYAEATVRIAAAQIDEKHGRARLEVAVNEGPLWRVASVTWQAPDGLAPPETLLAGNVGKPWTTLWRQDADTTIRQWYYERGHPDVRVELTPQPEPPVSGSRQTRVAVRIRPGPQVRLNAVRFTGNTHTREATMRHLVPAHEGEPLNPVELDNGRARLARLGVFRRVDLNYEPTGPNERTAIYSVTEGRLEEVNLLAGYGSYEQLRGGIEWQHFNLWGRAHSDTLKLVQSMKSTSAEYRYTIPEIFGTTTSGTARVYGLRREELAFTSEEYGANFSLSRPLPKLRAAATVTYTLRQLRATDNELATRASDETAANVASLDLRLVQDRRDNPLLPRRGHRVFMELEEASKALGGEVDYQRLTVGGSYHTKWGNGRWVHVGLEHAIVTTFGAPDDRSLPVNVRFFPGGEDSIRGFQRGEAAPRTDTGEFVGAKSYLQMNLELEQAIATKLSAVVFFDALGTATRLADYPFDEKLFSAGLGLRYNTLIGPIRLEYGYNLNPRPRDPRGTLLFSVGFPF